MCKSILDTDCLSLMLKPSSGRVGGTALPTLCPVLLQYFLWKEMAEIWIESEQEMSAVVCHYFLRNEMNLF